jgi:hypothetical protein
MAAPSGPPRFPPQPMSEADLAAQVARINAEAMADAPPAPQEKSGGIFSRLTRKREPVPPPSPAPPPQPPQFTPASADTDLAAQLARINAEAAAEASAAAAPEKTGGIFARLTRKREPVPPLPPLPDAGMGGAGVSGASIGDASMDEGQVADASMGESFDASMGDAGMGDAGVRFDTALADEALPGEKPPRAKPPIVTIGWLVLALFVASVIGTLALAPATVMSVLPGAARLYSLFGMPVGASGLALENVRYGWTSDGGQSVLEIQGDVVNLTSGAAAVPTVVIALRDEGGEEISEWTTEIGEEQLAGGERAPFLRQIPSPPSNVRSVAVRFAKAK